MTYDEVVAALTALAGGPVCVTVAEAGGAGAEVADFSGALSCADAEEPATEDERLTFTVGKTDGTGARFVLERPCFLAGEATPYGLRVRVATIDLMIEDLTRPASVGLG
jgi:hypothetical protein